MAALLVAIFIVEAAEPGLSTSGLMRVVQSERLLHRGRLDDNTEDGIAVVCRGRIKHKDYSFKLNTRNRAFEGR